METRAFRLRLRGPLHVGAQSIGLETSHAYIPSDTLFGALVVALAGRNAMRTVIDDLAATFAADPPLAITSAFPAVGHVLLLPKPNLALIPSSVAVDGMKHFKRAAWVSASVFEHLIAGPSQTELDELWQEAVLAQGETVWLSPEEAAQINQARKKPTHAALDFWSLAREPKVTVGRADSAGAIFHVGRVHFAEDCSLWCAARGTDDWLRYTTEALTLLQDQGLGGKRSQGNGQFALDALTTPPVLTMASDAQGDYAVLLSRLAPQQADLPYLTQERAAYRLETVGGFLGTPTAPALIRKQVRLVAEGSIIGASHHVPGRLVDVTPAPAPHPVYRYGIGFTVPVRLPQEVPA